MYTQAQIAQLLRTGRMKNSTGRTLTSSNAKTLHWTGSRYVYVLRGKKGKKLTRDVSVTGKVRGARKPRTFASTTYSNRQHRAFMQTQRMAYVIRRGNESLYRRKARYVAGALMRTLMNVPGSIRPRRLPKK
jgi:hypothetical protein